MSNIAWDNTRTINLRYNYKHHTNITCNKNKAKSYEANNNYNKSIFEKRGKILVEHNKKYRPTQLGEEPS